MKQIYTTGLIEKVILDAQPIMAKRHGKWPFSSKWRLNQIVQCYNDSREKMFDRDQTDLKDMYVNDGTVGIRQEYQFISGRHDSDAFHLAYWAPSDKLNVKIVKAKYEGFQQLIRKSNQKGD